MLRKFALAALLLSLAVPVSAMPNPGSETGRRSVSTAGLNLASPAAIAVLDGRIRRAARQLCGTASPLDLREWQDARRCHSEAVSSAASRRLALIGAAGSQGMGGPAAGE